MQGSYFLRKHTLLRENPSFVSRKRRENYTVMDIGYLLNILLRRKWLILSVALAAAVVTFLLVGKLPPTYKADAVIETGIIKFKGRTISRDNPFMQKFMVESAFNDLLDQMVSRRSVRMLTNELLHHDLIKPVETGTDPFRLPDLEDSELSSTDFEDFVAVFTSIGVEDSTDAFRIERHNQMRVNDLAKAFGYDYKTITEDLEITRKADTDNIEISFTSENPELSYFVVQKFSENFLSYYENELNAEGDDKIAFYQQERDDKKRLLDAKVRRIEGYRSEKGLVDLETQGETVVGQIKDLEIELEEQRSLIPALRQDLAATQQRLQQFGGENGREYTSVTILNERLQNLRDEQSRTIDEFYDSGQDKKLGKRISELSTQIDEVTKQIANARVEGRRAGVRGKEERVESLYQRQLDLEEQLNSARSKEKSLTREIRSLQGRKSGFTRDDAELNRLERERDILEKDYLDVESKLREAQLNSRSTPNPLTVIEPPQLPDEPEPSKRLLLSAFSGFGGGTLATLAVLLMAFFDKTMQNAGQLRRHTRLPVVGTLPRLKAKRLDLGTIFSRYIGKPGIETFKENIRRLRQTIAESGGQSFLVVSPKPGEGKSFLILMLAYSFSLSDKKVLIVDTNFKHNTLSGYAVNGEFEVKDVSKADKKSWFGGNKIETHGLEALTLRNVTIMGNRGGAQSPNEILVGKNFGGLVERYKRQYDYIFLEAATMNQYSDARELVPYADKVIGIVSTESELSSKDAESIEYLQSLGDKYLGTVLNLVEERNV